jgi:hypothetical protein
LPGYWARADDERTNEMAQRGTEFGQSPTAGVDYDENALKDAVAKFHASQDENHDRDPDPEGGHDREALEEAAERMGTDR